MLTRGNVELLTQQLQKKTLTARAGFDPALERHDIDQAAGCARG